MHSPGIRRLSTLTVALAGLLSPGLAPALGQDAVQYGDPAVETDAADQVAIRVENFGVGDMVRAGEWAGIHLALTDRAEKPREVAVQLHIADGDGDTTLYQRIVILNPSREMGVWLYARLPWDMTQGKVLRISVSEASPREDGSVEVGRQIAWKPIPLPRVVSANEAMLAVIGQATLGFDQYAAFYQDRETSPGAHEASVLAAGLTPQVLPDMWMGLGSFETILWSQGDPATLPGESQASALREWINRGGHLVIVLPDVGNTWSAGANPLADLMPACKVDSLEDADLAPYAPLLSGRSAERKVIRGALHRFMIAPDTPLAEATPLITGPHGIIAVRRLVGTGMVTLIGLDLADRKLGQTIGIRADVFWPRILGKRAAALSQAEISALATKTQLARAQPTMQIDEQIPSEIAKSREASVGIILGLIVFVTYWLIAGPLGFGLLRAKGLERHSWVLFVGAAGVFTAVAWAGASMLRPKLEQAWHYTLLDHVYGQPVERIRAFVSVLLPRYGEQTVTLGDPSADKAWRETLTPWSDPAADSRPAFPDARSYEADVRSMTSLTVPARSTIKTFQADWCGGPRWSMPVPAGPDQAPMLDSSGRLSGTLIHNLPGALKEVHIFLVRRQVGESALRYRETFTPQPLVAEVYAWREESWAPEAPLPLSGYAAAPAANAKDKLENIIPKLSIMDRTLPASTKPEDLDDMISLYGVLEQPDPTATGLGTGKVPAVVRRRMVHTLDLAEWFTQPCLIIIGRLEDVQLPMPMSVDGHLLDGRDRPCSGRTVVRWVYPLSPMPVVVGGGPGTAN